MSSKSVLRRLADTPTEWGGYAKLVEEAGERYESLGVLDWALEQSAQDARETLRSWNVFFTVHRISDDELSVLADYFQGLWLSGLYIPIAKWATAVPLALMAGTIEGGDGEPPPRPDFLPESLDPLRSIFLNTKARKHLHVRLTERTPLSTPTRRALSLAWSLLGSKAMFPSMWVDQVGKSLEDHSKLLSSQAPPMGQETFEMLDLVAESISRLTTPKVTTYDQLPRPKLSSSAGWVKLYDQETRRFTTMRGTRAAQHRALESLQPEGHRPLFSMDYRPSTGVVEFRQHAFQFHWKEWDWDPTVSVVALQEPFKIRTISIADGPATAAGSPLQKLWHGCLRNLRPFSLIGGKRVADQVMEMGFLSFDGTPFVSGDYSAATDRLSMRATRVILNGLLKRVALDPELRKRLEVGLTSSVLDYSTTLAPFKDKVPEKLLKKIPLPEKTQQTNGQLMGNILSFPILCLVNLAGYLLANDHPDSPIYPVIYAAKKRGHFLRSELDNLPVLINGDDILFQADRSTYQRWLSVIGELGLKVSVGKNYYTPLFFTINSELYTRTGFQTRPWWGGFETDLIRLRNEIRYEVGEDVLSADMTRVMPRLQEFLRQTVSEAQWPLVNRLWIEHYQKSGILDAYKGLNWFIPTSLGGLGLTSEGFPEFSITHAQRALASRLTLDPDSRIPKMPGAESSLMLEGNKRKLSQLLGTSLPMHGELYRDMRTGRRYILDSDQPIAVRTNRLFYRGHPLVDDVVSRSTHVDSWMDYHVQGIRLETDRVRQRVTRALHWGLQLSQKNFISDDKIVDQTRRFRCLTKVEHTPVSQISRA